MTSHSLLEDFKVCIEYDNIYVNRNGLYPSASRMGMGTWAQEASRGLRFM